MLVFMLLSSERVPFFFCSSENPFGHFDLSLSLGCTLTYLFKHFFFSFLFFSSFLCHFKVVGAFFHTVVIWTVLPRKLAFTPKRQIYASFYFMCGSTGTF